MAMEEKDAKTLRVKTDTDEFVLHGHPCELSAFSYIAPDRHLPKERTYFNVEKKVRHDTIMNNASHSIKTDSLPTWSSSFKQSGK